MKNNFTSAVNYFKKIAKSVFIFKNLWEENTTALFHSPRSTDKLPIISEILTAATQDNRQVLYVNTEHRANSLPERFANNENLFIFTPEYDDPNDPADYADLVIDGIEEAVKTTEIRTFIIDSVTRIAALSFGRNASPAYIMKRLCALQLRYNLSLLVIAHDATKATDRALAALADSVIEPEAPEMTDQQSIEHVSDNAKQPKPSKKADRNEKSDKNTSRKLLDQFVTPAVYMQRRAAKNGHS